MSELKIKRDKPGPSMTVLRLQGEFEGLDVLNAKQELLGYLESEKNSDFVLDFSEINYIDSAGVGVLFEMGKRASERKLRFGVLNVNENIKKVLTITKVDKVLKIY